MIHSPHPKAPTSKSSSHLILTLCPFVFKLMCVEAVCLVAFALSSGEYIWTQGRIAATRVEIA